MADKVKTFLKIVAHTLLSFVAALFGGFMFYAFIRPIVGKEHYRKTPHDPVMFVLLLLVVLLGGVVAYRRWADRCAFFAWVLPALWLCHLMLSRGMEVVRGRWSDDPLFFFAIGLAYSVGALIAAMTVRKTFGKATP